MEKKKQIALFLPLLGGGGAEKVMVNLSEGFADRGFDVDLVLGRAEGPYLSQVCPRVRVVDLRSPRVLASLPGLIRYLHLNRPQAMISALDHANLVALWAKQYSGVTFRSILSLHSSVLERKKNISIFSKQAVFPFLVRRCFPRADAIVAVSRGVAEDYSQATGIPISRFEVIYNPVVTDEMLRKARAPLNHCWFGSGKPPVVLAIGRLSEAKDHSLLIKAFATVKKRMPARLLILGEGELRPQLETQIRASGLADSVSLPGFVANPYAYLSRAALFALSSKREGLPTALIESLAVGTPVVATNCRSGPSEILQHGKLGTLVPVGDADGLAEAMIASLQRTGTKSSGDAFLNNLEVFKPEHAVSSYLKIL